MSIYVTSHAWQHSAASGSDLLVLLAICDFADDEGRAYPAVATLAHKARTSERTVQYALRRLIEIGELTVEHGRGLNGSNLYRVQVQNLRGADSAGVQSTTERGATGCTQTVNEPSLKKKKENAGAKQSAIGFDSETATFTGIAFDQLALWKRAHAGVDVDTELVRAACWLIANPARRKSNYARFLTNWLLRADDPPMPAPKAYAFVPRANPTHRDRRDQWARGLVGGDADEGEGNVIDVDARNAA